MKDITDSKKNDEAQEEIDWGFVITNKRLFQITNTPSIEEFYELQQRNWVAHVIRRENSNPCKQLMFHAIKNKKLGKKVKSILEQVVNKSLVSRCQLIRDCFNRAN